MENKCTLSNEDLIQKANDLISKLAASGGKSWSLSVPVDFNSDPDILFSELGNRLREAVKKAERWDKLNEKIGKYYQEEQDEDYNDEFEGNLCDIGETAALAFGYL